MSHRLTRRTLLRQAGAAAVALPWFVSSARAAGANDRLNLGVIGVGGRGRENLWAMAGENIVALCDVDRGRLGAAAREFPKAKTYTDLRKLLDDEKDLDGVVVSTADHTHAVATVRALDRGLHVYCEKPLTHWIGESRAVARAAAKAKRVTQMGTGAQSTEGEIRKVEILRSGAIGLVEAVHIWTDRPIWPQGQARPEGSDPAGQLDWDCWLGPASPRPFKAKYEGGPWAGRAVYHPFDWRGWWDFGTGAIGDIAPHVMNVIFWALELGAPTRVEARSSGMMPEAFPSWSIVDFDFAGGKYHKPLRMTWYDGGKRPPADLIGGERIGHSGMLIVGEKGKLLGNRRLLPRKEFAGYEPPARTLPRRAEIHHDWIRAIKHDDTTGCPFDYAAPMTEAYLLGNIALRVGEPIEWDAEAMRVTNVAEAQQYVDPAPRAGWEL